MQVRAKRLHNAQQVGVIGLGPQQLARQDERFRGAIRVDERDDDQPQGVLVVRMVEQQPQRGLAVAPTPSGHDVAQGPGMQGCLRVRAESQCLIGKATRLVDVKRAQAAFNKVLETGGDSPSLLEAARKIAELFAEGTDLKQMAAVLETIAETTEEKSPPSISVALVKITVLSLSSLSRSCPHTCSGATHSTSPPRSRRDIHSTSESRCSARDARQ
mgnify:CR=1 FL=1